MKVLIVEDERLTAQAVAQLVDAHPACTVTGTAANGEQALGMMKNDPADLVITDIRMPVMDGRELMNRLSDAYPNTSVMVLSGYSEYEYIRTALQNRVCDYLLKPVDEDELNSLLDRIHKKRQNLPDLTPPDQLADTNKIMDAIAKELTEHYEKPHSVESLAREFHFAARYLNKAFKDHMGVRPMEYLLQVRIKRAKELLEAMPDVMVKDIAAHVGFKDALYFSKIFKRETGLWPSEYQAR